MVFFAVQSIGRQEQLQRVFILEREYCRRSTKIDTKLREQGLKERSNFFELRGNISSLSLSSIAKYSEMRRSHLDPVLAGITGTGWTSKGKTQDKSNENLAERNFAHHK